MTITDADLIARAAAIINPQERDGHLIGDVGCALLSAGGNLYFGVCIDVGSGIGFCAEHSAIAAMVTAGEYQIERIVATWKGQQGKVHVVAPCGRCREFMRQIHPDNIHRTQVILNTDHTVKLSVLLPHHTWYQPIDS